MGQVDLKDYSYTRSDEELVERRESAKKAKYKLLTKILKEYKNDEVAPAYSEMDLDGNGIQEIIIRTFTDQATEGGRYICQIYAYNDAKLRNGMLSRLVPMEQRKLPLRYSRMCREFVWMRISNIPETGRDKRESCKSIL